MKSFSTPDFRAGLKVYDTDPVVVPHGERIFGDRDQIPAAHANCGDVMRYKVDGVIFLYRGNDGRHYRAAVGASAFQIDLIAHHKLMDAFEIHSAPPDFGVRREMHRDDFLVELCGDRILLDRDECATQALVAGHFGLSGKAAEEDAEKQRSHILNLIPPAA